MTPKQESAISQITARSEYDITRSILKGLVDLYPDMQIGVFDHGHRVEIAALPRHVGMTLACAHGPMDGSDPEIYTMKSIGAAAAILKQSLKMGAQA